MSNLLRIAKSEFLALLSELIDGTKIFKRREWAIILGVSPAAISQWLSGTTIPRADILRTVVDILDGHDRLPEGLLERFWSMSKRPVSEVAPESAGRFGTKNIGEYLLAPALKGFHRNFDPLPVEHKE